MSGSQAHTIHMRKRRLELPALAVALTILSAVPAAGQSAHSQHHAGTGGTDMQTPRSLAAEHRELHEILARASKEGGDLGSAADELERALAPHFRREEEVATPPLGLLPKLAKEDATAEMRAVLAMTDALERELPQMLREHDTIRQAVAKFRAVAGKAGREEYVRFSDELAAHALQEEEILYPAAILVGRYVARTAPDR
jgi:iron-sulfur cluster repair protein YtfE (RIC family)